MRSVILVQTHARKALSGVKPAVLVIMSVSPPIFADKRNKTIRKRMLDVSLEEVHSAPTPADKVLSGARLVDLKIMSACP